MAVLQLLLAIASVVIERGSAEDDVGVVVPTAAQLRWMEEEIGAIGHFNMGTFEACGIGLTDSNMAVPPPSTFAPTNVQPEQWVKALASFGVKRAVLVVSHGCGFNTFPSRTNVTLADGRHFVYNYSVANSPWKSGKGDIAAEFVAACKAHNIRPGFYHGSVNNAFLNVKGGTVGAPTGIPGQAVITQDDYETILLANLRQLWTDYGELAEVWFDGGIPSGFSSKLWALHQELQPNAVAFQGPTVGTKPNLIRWAGTEGGHVKYPFWSQDTAKAPASPDPGQGTPTGAWFAPGEADTCFQGSGLADATVPTSEPEGRAPYGGCWFYNSGMNPKSLPELVSSYHDSVGKNAFWLLDWTPTKEGVLRPDHITRYAELGDWLHECYNTPVATIAPGGDKTVSVAVPPGQEVDRVVVQEDLSVGQRVRNFTINVNGVPAASGSSIGHKWIALLDKVYPGGSKFTLDIQQAVGTPKIKTLSLFNCSRTPTATGCSYQKDFKWKIVPSITIATLPGSTLNKCCSACQAHTNCAVFVFDTNESCTLLSANQGGAKASGVTSGTPKR